MPRAGSATASDDNAGAENGIGIRHACDFFMMFGVSAALGTHRITSMKKADERGYWTLVLSAEKQAPNSESFREQASNPVERGRLPNIERRSQIQRGKLCVPDSSPLFSLLAAP